MIIAHKGSTNDDLPDGYLTLRIPPALQAHFGKTHLRGALKAMHNLGEPKDPLTNPSF